MGERIFFKDGTDGKKHFNQIEANLETIYGPLERHEVTQILKNNIGQIKENLPNKVEEAKKQ